MSKLKSINLNQDSVYLFHGMFGKFPLKIPNFSVFSLLYTAGQKYAWVRSGPISICMWAKSKNSKVTFQIKKRINTGLFIGGMAALIIGWTRISNAINKGGQKGEISLIRGILPSQKMTVLSVMSKIMWKWSKNQVTTSLEMRFKGNVI